MTEPRTSPKEPREVYKCNGCGQPIAEGQEYYRFSVPVVVNKEVRYKTCKVHTMESDRCLMAYLDVKIEIAGANGLSGN
jgi:hypothetical protein